MIMVAGDSAGEMVMMWSCCRSDSARRSGEETAEKTLIPIGPQDTASLKNENTVIILIRCKVFFPCNFAEVIKECVSQRSSGCSSWVTVVLICEVYFYLNPTFPAGVPEWAEINETEGARLCERQISRL